MSDWLDNLKVNDLVIVVEHGRPVALRKVKRLTKTLVITEKDHRYRRKDGHAPGAWSVSSIQEPTDEAVDAIKHANLVHHLRHVDWKSLPLATLKEVYHVLPRKSP